MNRRYEKFNQKCIRCGKETEYDVSTPVERKKFYKLYRSEYSFAACGYRKVYFYILECISWGGGRHHPERLSIHPFAQLKQFGLVDQNEPIEFPRSKFGNDVWIGMDATIIAGVTIADGAVIGAGSIVTKDVPPYAIVFGSPAKVYKMRFSEKVIDILQKIKWWGWPDEILKNNIDLFSKPLLEENLSRLQAIYEDLRDKT